MNLLAAFLRTHLFAFIIPVYCLFPLLNAQTPPREEPDIHAFIQDLFPATSEEMSSEELFEFFFQLLADPLDLNHATEDQLTGTFILSNAQVKSLISYRHAAGPFLSLYELQAIPGLDLATIRRLIPFVTVESKPAPLKSALRNPTQHFFVTRMRRISEKQKGFSPVDPASRSVTRYAGSPWQWYARYRYARTGAFSIGLTLEKDAGETLNWNPGRQIYGPDFTSFHLQLLNRGRIKNLTIGDYQVHSGQGLVLASGFSLGKGAEVIRTTFRGSPGVKPYTSVMEQGFFRGAALTYGLSSSLEMTLFYSHKRRDGTIAGKGTLFDTQVITSFPEDGLHRTSTERNKHGNVLEKNYGGYLSYAPRQKPFRAGLTLIRTLYSLPVEKRNLPYNAYEFKGISNTTGGIYASYRLKNHHFFTESARSASGGTGLLAGVITALHKHWDIAFLWRDYRRHFHTFYGNPFRESTRPSNEKGLYSGVKYAPSRKFQYNAYVDIFYFPWKKYQVDTASAGNGFLLHALWQPQRHIKLYAVVRNEQKQKNNSSAVVAIPLATTARSTAMINFEWSRPRKYTLRTRLQGGRYRFGDSRPSDGFAVVQDATLQLKKLELSGRIGLFRTDDYDSRQYVFEKDALYSFSIPSYYDHGTRHYLMVRYDIARPVRIWVRWARTTYSRLEKIGSGLDEIEGNKRSEIKFQIMYRF